MSSKINVINIIRGHFSTLFGGQRLSGVCIDSFTFIGLPLLFCVLGLKSKLSVSSEIVSLAVNFGAIFTALLLSVLVLVYDQESKLRERIRESENDDDYRKYNHPHTNTKLKLMEQLYVNISYCILTSIALVGVAAATLFYAAIDVKLIAPWLASLEPIRTIFTPLIIYLLTHLIITILMVVKRIHALLVIK